MTGEEQIICKYKFEDKEKFNGKSYCTCFNELCEDLAFVCDHNCQIYEDFKQLARKTQECEELKKKLRKLESENVTLQNRYQQIVGATTEAARYREALEKIEEIVKINCEEICGRKLEDCNDFLCPSKNIIDIINKAKDKICYWDKSIDMSKATLQVDGEIICKFDNDNQTVILVNDNYLNKTKEEE